MNDKKNELDTLLEKVSLKNVVKGDNGELVTLVDVDNTRMILTETVEKYKELKITPENYKKEGAEAERILREFRYTLQNVEKSGMSVLNDAKKEYSKGIKELIDITVDLEKKLKGEIDLIKKKEKDKKEEEEKRKQERIEKIESRLRANEEGFEKLLVHGREEKDLIEYNSKLDVLEGEYSLYDELAYQAKRIYATYFGRRKELEAQIAKFTKEEEERKDFEDEKKKMEEQKLIIFDFRVKQLKALKFILNDVGQFVHDSENSGLKEVGDVSESDVKEATEIEWFKILGDKTTEIKDSVSKQDKEAEEALNNARDMFLSLVDTFEKLGGKKGTYTLKDGEAPTGEILKLIQSETLLLQKKRKQKIRETVGKEIEPYKDEALKFLSNMDKKINKNKFKNEQSKEILINLMSEFELVVNRVLGEVYEK